LRVFEYEVVRGDFSPKKYEIMGVWRKLQNEEPQVKEDEMGRVCNTHWRADKYLQILVGKPERKRLPEEPVSR
jgi:hypothetical protein